MIATDPQAQTCVSEDLPDRPRVTVFIPTRNEGVHVVETLEAVLGQDYAAELLHILLVDGMSTDDTRVRARALLAAQDRVSWEIVDNPEGDLTHAYMHAWERVQGDVFTYVCGHAKISPDYVSAVVRALKGIPCDAVGGPYRMVGRTATGKAVAAAWSCPFGVGASTYRYAEELMPTESPPMASYRASLIRREGFFDPESRGYGEDWEYHHRLRQAGARMYLDPSIHAEFHARDSFWSLVVQARKYGIAKGWLTRTHGWRILRPSHLVPTAWVAFNLIFLVGALFCPYSLYAWLAGVSAYVVTAIWAAAGACRRRGHSLALVPRVALAFVIMHALYGIGLVRGLVLGRGKGAQGAAAQPKAAAGDPQRATTP